MRTHVAAILCAAALAAPVHSQAAEGNTAVLARAKAWFAALQSGQIDRTQMTETMSKSLTDDQLKGIAAKYGPLGDPTSFEPIQTGSQSGSTIYTYRLGFSNGDHLDFLFAIDGTDKVSGFYVLPPQ